MIIIEDDRGDGHHSNTEENNLDKSNSHKQNNEGTCDRKLEMHCHV